MTLYYDRTMPFGFTDEQTFFSEAVTVENPEKQLKTAQLLRKLYEQATDIQREGFDSQSQADAVVLLMNKVVG